MNDPKIGNLVKPLRSIICGHSPLLKKLQILVIEDNPADSRLLQEAFAQLSSNVVLRSAKDGIEALEIVSGLAAKGERPDLVLLDLSLPKLSGHEVLAHIKQDPRLSSTPVIVLTSSAAESDVRRAYEFHANAYLQKPISLDGLLATAGQIKDFWMHTATLPR